jgi:ketosteroid isomerase-like protein
MRRRSWIGSVALLAACADPSTPTAPAQTMRRSVGEGAEASANAKRDLREERAALAAADRAHAAASAGGLLAGLTATFVDDVVLLYPGAPVLRGRAAATTFLTSLPGAATQTLTWQPAFADVSGDATRGYSYGDGTRVVGGVSSPIQYAAYWRREGGRWRTAAWLLRAGYAGTARALPARCAAPTTRHERHFPRTEEAEQAAELLRTDATFSALSERAGGAAAFGTYVADGGVLLLGDAQGVACGPDEMRVANDFGPGVLTWAPTLADAAPSGDLGMTVGIGAFRAGTQTFHSKYLTIWKKQRSGDWRFVLDAGNATPAP